jgi:hypothetical protein
VALKEIGFRPTWRKTGTARRIHDTLLATRDVPFVTLMVNPAAGDGRVHARPLVNVRSTDPAWAVAR